MSARKLTPVVPTAFPLEVWECIAYHCLADESQFLGPVTGLTSLLLVCEWLHSCLSFESNPRLYARLFLFKFDYSAVTRRLSSRWLTTRCLAAELQKRMLVLQRVRRQETLQDDDLWTCQIMLLENDGRNERQLECADLSETLLQNVLRLCRPSLDGQMSWFKNSQTVSLTLWILWLMSTPERLLAEPTRLRSLWTSSLLPKFITAGFKFSSIYAPDSMLYLPVSSQVENVPPTVSGPLPKTTTIIHYSLPLKVAVPILAPAALLAWVARRDVAQSLQPLDNEMLESLPPNRAAALASHRTGPTVDDVLDFHRQRIASPERLRLSGPSTWNTFERLSSTAAESDDRDEDGDAMDRSSRGSREHDQDWYRLVSCFDIYALSRPLKGVLYPLGCIAGRWAGRYFFTNIEAHIALLNNEIRADLESTPLYAQPLHWDLREHHCMSAQGLPPGIDAIDGDDVLNAWLPRGFKMTEYEDAIEVSDPDTPHPVRYDTFYPNGASDEARSRLNSDTCCYEEGDVTDDCLGRSAEDENEDSYEEVDLDATLSSDEYVDTVSQRNSGVADILVTGETSQRHGDAWGHYRIVGRVRPWDGLVVLLREPKNPAHAALGSMIFKGYLHGRNFVGRWRETTTAAGLIGYEGSFVVTRCT